MSKREDVRGYDINEYDTIRVFVKEKQADELADVYAAFLWEATEKKEHSRYDDVVDFSFRRPHKIENKDELQFLQVAAEHELDVRDKLDKNKHALSTSLGIFLGLLGGALVFFGLFLLFRGAEATLPCFLLVLGAAIFICAAIAVRKIVLRENKRYFEKKSESVNRSKDVLFLAKRLTGKE